MKKKTIVITGLILSIIFIVLSGFVSKKYFHKNDTIKQTVEAPEGKKPNIILILADDLGYGDVQFYSPKSKIPTPNINKLASQSLSFMNAHAAASVCTPSRYSILTGRYPWRSHIKKGVIWVWGRPMIDSGRFTIGEMLKDQGYNTACIGKWHLGVDWPTTDGRPATLQNEGRNVDYDKPIKNGPIDRGFDYYFGQLVPSFPPHAFIENDRMVTKPTSRLGKNEPGIPGAMAPGWRYEDLMYNITNNALQYIRKQAVNKHKKPFFLYFSMSAPHTPIAPREKFQGKTKVGRYGDYVYEMDYHIGQILNVLDSLDISKNTLVIFSSDNGAVNEDGLKYSSPVGALIKNYGHNSNDGFRGMKSDSWEGGHRMPFIVRWPGHVKANSRSDALISQVDMMATFAALSGAALPEDAAEDSYNILPVFIDGSRDVRQDVVVQSGEGILSIQKRNWKLILCSGGGGKWNPVGSLPVLDTVAGIPLWKNVQLYNLDNDITEENNLIYEQPEKVWELMGLLKQYIVTGRSTPGKSLNKSALKLWPEVEWIKKVE